MGQHLSPWGGDPGPPRLSGPMSQAQQNLHFLSLAPGLTERPCPWGSCSLSLLLSFTPPHPAQCSPCGPAPPIPCRQWNDSSEACGSPPKCRTPCPIPSEPPSVLRAQASPARAGRNCGTAPAQRRQVLKEACLSGSARQGQRGQVPEAQGPLCQRGTRWGARPGMQFHS
jgi:hypothetical protein